MSLGAVKHLQRATRAGGRETRSRLLEAAAALFLSRGFADVAMTEIAAAADAFPSQISYYFKTKEALFVEAACRELLHLGARAEDAAGLAVDEASYGDALVETVAPSPVLALMIEAMALARRRGDLTEMIARTFQRLYEEGTRAFAAERVRRGWAARGDAAATSQRFWDLAFGISLRVGATGGDAALAVSEMKKAMRVDASREAR